MTSPSTPTKFDHRHPPHTVKVENFDERKSTKNLPTSQHQPLNQSYSNPTSQIRPTKFDHEHSVTTVGVECVDENQAINGSLLEKLDQLKSANQSQPLNLGHSTTTCQNRPKSPPVTHGQSGRVRRPKTVDERKTTEECRPQVQSAP